MDQLPLLLSQMDEIAKLDSILNRRGSLLLLQNEWSVDYLIRGLLDQNQFNALALHLLRSRLLFLAM